MIRSLLLGILACGVANAATVKVQRLLTVGDTAAGVAVTNLRQVSQNERGEIAVGGNAVGINNTLWAGYPGLLQIVAGNGQAGPGGGAFTSVSGSTLIVPVINDEGAVAFLASQGGTGLYTWVDGEIGKVAGHGEAVPGIAGATFFLNTGNVSRPFFGTTNLFQFLCRMDGNTTSADNMALWGGVAGAPQLIAREGGAIPGQPGLSFPTSNFIFETTSTNTVGQTALSSLLTGPGVVAGVNDNAVLVGGAGGFSMIVRGGDAAVAFGLPPDATFAAVGDNWPVRINDFGEVLFFAALKGTGVSGTLFTGNHTSLWKGPPGGLQMIARRADLAPGLPPGVTFLLATSLVPDADHLALAASGDAAFITTLGGSVTAADDTALYMHRAGVNLLVLREGAPAPGQPAGVVFNNLSSTQGWRLALNSAGQLAILADLTGTGVTNANDAALYFWSQEDGLQLIAREGGSVETAPGVFQTIASIELNGTHGDDSGSPRNFNSRGQLTFTATLDGAASIVRATLVNPATYELLTSTTHSAGGQTVSSANYRVNADTTASGGLGTSAAYAGKMDFVGQLYDPVALSPTAAPSIVSENSSTQLSAVVTMDDDTFLPLAAGVAQWSIASGPLLSIDPSTNVALTGVVYQTTTATARARFGGLSNTVNIEVMNTNIDDLAQYAGDGITDAWQVQHFGLPPNANAAPTANPDFDGQDNLFEFLAGNDPNDSKSAFTLKIGIASPNAYEITLNKTVPGTIYRVLKAPTLDTADPWPELTSFTVGAVQLEVVVEDVNPPANRGFYKVVLEKQ